MPAIDRASIVEYHKTYYRPNNAFLLVTGDVDAGGGVCGRREGVWRLGARHGSAAAGGAGADAARAGRSSSCSVPTACSRRSRSATSRFAADDPRWPVLNVANQIYGGAFDSRLVRNIREEKGYTYSPQSVVSGDGAGRPLSGRGRRAQRRHRRDASRRSTARSTSSAPRGPAPTELDNAKVYARGLFVIQNATQSGLSNTLNTMYSFGLPNDYLETFQKTVSTLSPEAIKTAAQMLLGSEDSVIVIVGDYTKVKDQLAAFKDIAFVDISGKPIAAPQ